MLFFCCLTWGMMQFHIDFNSFYVAALMKIGPKLKISGRTLKHPFSWKRGWWLTFRKLVQIKVKFQPFNYFLFILYMV